MVNEVIMKRYNNLCKLITEKIEPERRQDFISLMQYVENETDWFSAPASTKYHCSYEGGLLEHSINVAETAYRIKKILAPEISDASMLLVALLHDVGKTGQYIMNPPTPKQQQYGYPGTITFNENQVWMEHASRSLSIISKFMKLTDEEWAAIEYHDQPYYGQSCAFRKNKLMTILQNGDYWSACYLEVGGSK